MPATPAPDVPDLTARDAFEDALAEQLVGWRAEFERLTARLPRGTNGRPRGGKAYKILATKHAALLRCLREARDVTDHGWPAWRERTELAWEELQAATVAAGAELKVAILT